MFQPLFLLFLCYFLLNGTRRLLRKLPGHRHQIAEEGTPGVWVQLERGQSLGGLAGPFVRRPNQGFVLSQAWKGFFDLLQELSHTCNYLSESPGTKSLPALGQDFLRTDLWCTWCAEHGPALLPSLIPGGFSGLQGGERTEVMWVLSVRTWNFLPVAWCLRLGIIAVYFCASHFLYSGQALCTLMVLMAKGGLQLNGTHMHQNFRVKKDRNQKIFGVLWLSGFFVFFCRLLSSFIQACGTPNKFIN